MKKEINRFLIILIGGNCLYWAGFAFSKNLVLLNLGLAIIGWAIIVNQQKK